MDAEDIKRDIERNIERAGRGLPLPEYVELLDEIIDECESRKQAAQEDMARGRGNG